MNPPFSLAHGALRCDIVPALGGCIAGLWLGDVREHVIYFCWSQCFCLGHVFS